MASANQCSKFRRRLMAFCEWNIIILFGSPTPLSNTKNWAPGTVCLYSFGNSSIISRTKGCNYWWRSCLLLLWRLILTINRMFLCMLENVGIFIAPASDILATYYSPYNIKCFCCMSFNVSCYFCNLYFFIWWW